MYQSHNNTMNLLATPSDHRSGRGVVAYGALVGAILFPVSLALGFVWNAVLTRALPPGQVGIYALGMTVLGIVAMIVNMGIASSVSRFLPMLEARKDDAGQRYVVWLGLLVPLIVALPVGVTLFIARNYLGQWLGIGLAQIMIYVAIAVPFYAMLSTEVKIFIARRAPIISQTLSFAAMKLLPMVFVVIFIGFGMHGTAILTMRLVVISIITTALLGVVLVHFKVLSLVGGVSGRTVNRGEIIRYALPLTCVGVFSMMTLWMDTLMLGVLSNSESIAYYNTAYLLATLVRTLALMLPQTLLMPVMMTKFEKGDGAAVRGAYGGVARTSFLLAVPIAFYMIFLGPQLMGLAFGQDYRVGGGSLQILALLFMVTAFFGHSSVVVGVYGKSRWMLLVTIIALGVNAIGNYFLIPIFGIKGAAASAGAAEVLAAVLMLLRLPVGFVREISVARMPLLLLYGGAIFSALSFLPRANLLVAGIFLIVGTTIFLSLAWYGGGIPEKDKIVYVAILSRWWSLLLRRHPSLQNGLKET